MTRTFALPLLTSVALAACGDDRGTSASATATTTTATATATM